MSSGHPDQDALYEEANRLYWESDQSVNQIGEALDLSKGVLYGLIAALPAGLPCPSAGRRWSSRTGRPGKKGSSPAPSAGWKRKRRRFARTGRKRVISPRRSLQGKREPWPAEPETLCRRPWTPEGNGSPTSAPGAESSPEPPSWVSPQASFWAHTSGSGEPAILRHHHCYSY